LETSNYIDLSELQNLSEDLGPEALETSDYSDFEVTPVGHYLSQARDIKVKQSKDGINLTFELTFIGGIQDPASGRSYGMGQYPFRTWVSTKKFSRTNRPGATSTAAEYLRACGLDPKEGSLSELFEVSKTLPVRVYVAWEDKGEKQPDGTYTNAGLKTKDFNRGTKDAPQYVPSVTINGKTFTARARVAGFARIQSN
jgi:hypothetical protein